MQLHMQLVRCARAARPMVASLSCPAPMCCAMLAPISTLQSAPTLLRTSSLISCGPSGRTRMPCASHAVY